MSLPRVVLGALGALAVVLAVGASASSPSDQSRAAPARLAASQLYRAADGRAGRQERQWLESRPGAARLIRRIASQPTAIWPAGDPEAVRAVVDRHVAAAAERDEMPVLVAYNIPWRDCGVAGARTADDYGRWIRAVSAGIGDRPATVILEPDALAHLDCLAGRRRAERVALLRAGVEVLKRLPRALVYVDAGHSRWLAAGEAARRLRRVGIHRADGFSLNVANFRPTAEVTAYGTSVSRRLGGSRFVIDTGRNGSPAGNPADWCNPAGRSLGLAPETRTGRRLIDAYLWVKPPGESDGTCNGGPPAGAWWPGYALGLAARAAPSLVRPARSR